MASTARIAARKAREAALQAEEQKRAEEESRQKAEAEAKARAEKERKERIAREKAEAVRLIEDYRQGLVPLVVPVTLLRRGPDRMPYSPSLLVLAIAACALPTLLAATLADSSGLYTEGGRDVL